MNKENRQLESLTISIGICAYNEEGNIGALLENLLTKQYLPHSSEIIVICSGCTDKTPDIVEEFARKDKRVKLILEQERRGKSQALNVLFDNAKGDILVVVSADTRPAPGSLVRLLESIKPDIGGACAKTLPINNNQTIMEFCYWFLWKVHNRVLDDEARNGTLGHLGGDMWAIRKGIIHHIPRDTINDDAYLGIMLKKKGWRITFVQDAKVLIKGPATPIEYIQQRERIIIGHKQLKEMTDVEPTTIGALALKKPLLSLKIIVDEARTCRFYEYPKIFVGLFLEMIAQALARIKFKKKGEYVKWKQIKNTKIFN
jgi:cellulose synthase/poly-beta-1,6-N-acetylglucosamine synthase-like glycosyltransferase